MTLINAIWSGYSVRFAADGCSVGDSATLGVNLWTCVISFQACGGICLASTIQA